MPLQLQNTEYAWIQDNPRAGKVEGQPLSVPLTTKKNSFNFS